MRVSGIPGLLGRLWVWLLPGIDTARSEMPRWSIAVIHCCGSVVAVTRDPRYLGILEVGGAAPALDLGLGF